MQIMFRKRHESFVERSFNKNITLVTMVMETSHLFPPWNCCRFNIAGPVGPHSVSFEGSQAIFIFAAHWPKGPPNFNPCIRSLHPQLLYKTYHADSLAYGIISFFTAGFESGFINLTENVKYF